MPRPLRLLVPPLPSRAAPTTLAAMVAADAVRRHHRLGSIAGMVEEATMAAQHAAERTLAREGHDRSTLGAAELADRVAEHQRLAAAEVQAAVAELGVEAQWPAGTERAARTAFVCLYEEGLLAEEEAVVTVCARCATVATGADAEPADHDAEQVTLRLPLGTGGTIDVALVALELLPGVAAIQVPPDHPATGSVVSVPLCPEPVPVFSEPTAAGAALLIPAHDADAWQVVRQRLAVTPRRVIDAAGVVAADGPLRGLGRFAARTAARDLVAAAGLLAKAEPVVEPSSRCAHCGTALVPVLDRHWILLSRELRRAVADAVREGAIAFVPATARDSFLTAAASGDEWVVSGSLAAGPTIPVATCEACDQTAVEVDPGSSCRRCFGPLVADPRTFDPAFVAAAWGLAQAGWPSDEAGPVRTAPGTWVVADDAGLSGWVVAAGALGLRLTGRPPFAGVAVHPAPPDPGGGDTEGPDRRARRLWLVGGAPDPATAQGLVNRLDRPRGEPDEQLSPTRATAAPAAGPDLDELAAAVTAALDELTPAAAAAALGAALAATGPDLDSGRLAGIAFPILGG